MWFSVWTALATGGGGGGGAALVALLAALSSAFRNVLIRKKRATIDFFIKSAFRAGEGSGTSGIIPILGSAVSPDPVHSSLQFCLPTAQIAHRDFPQGLVRVGKDRLLDFVQLLQRAPNVAPGLENGSFDARSKPRKFSLLRDVCQPLFCQINTLAPPRMKNRRIAHEARPLRWSSQAAMTQTGLQ